MWLRLREFRRGGSVEEFVSPGGTNGEKVIFASGLARRVVFCR